jgi:predicted ATPase
MEKIMTFKLISANVKNYKSLGDIELNFRDLTIIVGANSSGKSNCLNALKFLQTILIGQQTSSVDIKDEIARYHSEPICYKLIVQDENRNKAEYSVAIQVNGDRTLINYENLIINGTKVINSTNGQGIINDEDGGNGLYYNSDSNDNDLVLRDVGKYGNKPLTKKLAASIRNWSFYDISPNDIRAFGKIKALGMADIFKSRLNIPPSLNSDASMAQEILEYLAINERDKFNEISQELENCLQISLKFKAHENIITIIEKDSKEISISNLSDGTLRLLAYCILLYESDIPGLVAIEEPERNFHPGILKDIASIIKRLSQRTQVVFTTHSSQLLDCFSPEEISSEISVILLSKKGELGTQAHLLDELARNRDDLLDWMTDFGLGSAIYHSQLIQEVLDSEYA